MGKIKIIHGADVHDDFEALKIYREHVDKENPDMAFIAGDLIEDAFTEDEIKDYGDSMNALGEKKQELIEGVVAQSKIIGEEKMTSLFPIELLVAVRDDEIEYKSVLELPNQVKDEGYSTKDLHDILKNPETPLDVQGAIKRYLDATDKVFDLMKVAGKNMEKKYNDVKDILKDSSILIIPGNHDGKCLEDILGNFSMHKKTKEIKGIKVTGYGSAQGTPSWIPEDLLLKFEYFGIQTPDGVQPFSEAGKVMVDNEPDIVLTHEMPLNDDGLRMYAEQKDYKLMLAGHVHELIKPFRMGTNKYIVMPGKIGESRLPSPDLKDLKTFTEITMNQTKKDLILEQISYKQIKDGNIKPFAEYNFDKDGDLESAKYSKDHNILKGAI